MKEILNGFSMVSFFNAILLVVIGLIVVWGIFLPALYMHNHKRKEKLR